MSVSKMEYDIEEIKEAINNLGIYKPSSQAIILSSIKKINKEVFDKTNIIDLNDFDDYDKVIDFITKQKSNNQKTYSNAIHVMMNAINANEKFKIMYTKIFYNFSRKTDDAKIYQKPNKKEKRLFRPWDEIIELRSQLREKYKKIKTKKAFYNYYILSLFTYLPPIRPQELCSCKIRKKIKDDADFNYYCTSKNLLCINNYKTVKSIGKRIISVPEKLHKLIINNGSNYLIPTPNGMKQQNPSALSVYFKRLTGFNPVLLRKIFISYIMDKGISPDEKKRIANIMGHSVSTQVLIYTKFSNSIHGKKKI